MARPTLWMVAPWTLALLVGVAERPEARVPGPPQEGPFPVSPTVPLLLEGCPSVEAREAFEGGDCLQAVRYELIEGRIDLDEAIARLERCAQGRTDLAAAARRSAAMRTAEYSAYLAFGIPTDSLHLEPLVQGDAALRARVEEGAAAIPDGVVASLRGAGIAPDGFARGRGEEALARLGAEERLVAGVESALGPEVGEDLRAILARDAEARPPAVIIGRTVVLPNLLGSEPSEPIAVGIDAYGLRVASELRALEADRLRYLASAARANQEKGSVRSFLTALRRLGKDGAGVAEAQEQVEADRAAMAERLDRLETRLGIHPLLARSAAESLGLASSIVDECAVSAARRGGWIRAGAGLVTGLVVAAGAVVVSGATGTLVGGITIAAALEAAVGAYFIARSERFDPPVVTTGRLTSVLPTEGEERPFRRPAGEEVAAESGEEGDGGGEFDEWFEDVGEPEELLGLGGEGIEDEEAAASTLEAPRENTIPAVLPVEEPEELRELPPLLEAADRPELAGLTLPEIQERLDEFLSLRDPAAWAMFAESDEAVSPVSIERMIEEARTALELWRRERTLDEGFGPFFVNAEIEEIPVARRAEVLPRALGRYVHDRDLYHDSRNVDGLRRAVAERLVAHCRAEDPAGDLVLSACTDETALSIVLIAAMRDAGVRPPAGYLLGVQAYGSRFEAVLFSEVANEVYSLTKGTRTEGVVAPILHPASFYYAYLVAHNVVPEIDFERHLLIALPDRPMPEAEEVEECAEEGGSVVGRAVEWLGSLVGVRRVSDPCGGDPAQRGGGSRGGGTSIDIAMPMPRNPFAGGGQSGGGQGGGGGGGSSAVAQRGPRDASSGGSSGGGQAGGGGGGDREEGSAAGTEQGQGGAEAKGSGAGDGDGDAAGGGAGGGGDSRAEQSPAADGGAGQGGGDAGGGAESRGSGGSGGFGVGNAVLPAGPNLAGLGRETVRMAERYARTADDRVVPWRLREDEAMMTGSATRVLYADNARALERFDADDLFITFAPAEVEAQRRMLEAESFPIYPAATTCAAADLPPRRVFRRSSTDPRGFRYVYCDQDESMVIFRDREDADSYAKLSPPDRPLYLARLAAERLERFERSPAMRRVQSFLADPNVLRGYSKEEIYGMVGAAQDVLVFQDALQSALVQSMNELGETGIRGYYYEMHREVLRAPFFTGLARDVYRLNRRLASDPLQSLAWANAQPELARRGFFDLYYNLGRMTEWPERWAELETRYGSGAPQPAEAADESLDFLRIVSDPTRVRVDWAAERQSRPSIRDREMQDGRERTTQTVLTPTLSDLLDREDEEKHLRGGTGGLGRAGLGTSMGPEEGRRPLQMVRIRLAPDAGDPERLQQFPDDNQVRPGGTEGEKRTQTEESASRQEAFLWVGPETFVEAALSTWDRRELDPRDAGRVPPIVRLNERLRQVFLRDLRPEGVYDNRLLDAMEVFTAGGWGDLAEVREAMGGSWVRVKAADTGRFSAAIGGNPPITEESQIRVPNFFAAEGVTLPADLFGPVQEHYTRTILGIFELASSGGPPEASPLEELPTGASEEAAADRRALLRTLEVVRQQALPAE